MSFNELQEQVRELAWRAVELDKSGQIESAVFFYLEASQAMVNFTQSEHFGQLSDSQRSVINAKLQEYISRAEALKKASLIQSGESTAGKNIFPRIKTELEVTKNLLFKTKIEKFICLTVHKEGINGCYLKIIKVAGTVFNRI
jgi:hypothetical protein